jgi:hypothetical protein
MQGLRQKAGRDWDGNNVSPLRAICRSSDAQCCGAAAGLGPVPSLRSRRAEIQALRSVQGCEVAIKKEECGGYEMSNKTLIEVIHSGKRYIFDPSSTAEPDINFDTGFYSEKRENIYVYSLKGCHAGEPIQIHMINPNYKTDEDGIAYVWDGLVYADNHERIDDVVDDFYTDALREDLKQIINDTWD